MMTSNLETQPKEIPMIDVLTQKSEADDAEKILWTFGSRDPRRVYI